VDFKTFCDMFVYQRQFVMNPESLL